MLLKVMGESSPENMKSRWLIVSVNGSTGPELCF